MRRIVLIDGENLTYSLRTLIATDSSKAERSALESFNYRGMFEELLADNLPTEILWFGARLRLYDDTPEIQAKSSAAIRSQAKFSNLIQSQNIHFVKVGYLRARETDPCEQCAYTTWRLAEKGVDVGLAVRMITEAATGEVEIIVVSADTDLLPAFKAASKLKAKLMHIGYEHRPIAALSHAANTTRTITLPIVQKYLV